MPPSTPEAIAAWNRLFTAALATRQGSAAQVARLAAEVLSDLDPDERARFASEIVVVRDALEDWAMARWDAVRGKWSASDTEAASEFARTNYPWLNEANTRAAINRGTWYAWHG